MDRASRWLGIFLHCGKCREAGKNKGSLPGEKKGNKSPNNLAGRVGKEYSIDKQSQAEAEATWLRNLNCKSETEQNKHAIAVAVASAAAVDAAVAAANAAVCVVRLTSCRKKTMFPGRNQVFAAVRIQSFFRGYLARKALKALKSLIQLQALIRGYLVRKKKALVLQDGRAPLTGHYGSRRSRKFLQTETHLLTPRESFENVRSGKRTSFSSRQLPPSLDSSSSSHEPSSKIVGIDTFREAMIYSPRLHHSYDYKCWFCSTTLQSSPCFPKSSPATPAKMASQEFKGLLSCPNYMTSTQSFAAKARPQSSPRHLGDLAARMAPAVNVAARNSCSQLPDAVRLRSDVIKKLLEKTAGELMC